MDDPMGSRDWGRADDEHKAHDAPTGHIGRPDRHAGSQVLHRTLAIRGRDARPARKADRTRRRT